MKVIFLAMLIFMLSISCAQAEDGSGSMTTLNTVSKVLPDDKIPGGMDGRISLDLRNIDVIDALKFLSMKANANIVSTKNVSGRITLMVEDVPIRDIFDIMLRSNGLAYSKEGNIYNVMTEDEYKALFGKKFADIREVRIFKLQYAIPEQAFSMLEALKSEIGRVLVDSDSGTVLIMDTPEKIEAIEKTLARIEKKNLLRVFTLKYAKAKEVEDQLKNQLDAKKVGTIRADERSNQVIVQTLPDRMEDTERLIEALDKKTKVVIIDTEIIKIKLSDQLDNGINWEGIASKGQDLGFMYLGSTPFGVLQTATTAAATALPSRLSFFEAGTGKGVGQGIPFSSNGVTNIGGNQVAPGEALHFGLIDDKRDFDIFVKFLQTLGKSQILSRPKLAVINNQEARIHVGERQAYVTTTTTTGQTTTTVSEAVTFVDVGIQLSVTPTINDEGDVVMKVKPEISSVVSTLITPSNNKIPIIDTSMAETSVMVKDGTTIVIGGLRKEEKTSSYEQLPWLGNIPLLGNLFKTGNGKKERTELLILLTPHIITGDKFTTGDDREFHHKPEGKEYEAYPSLTDQTDYKPPVAPLGENIKSYVEYTDGEKEDDFGIKGAKHE